MLVEFYKCKAGKEECYFKRCSTDSETFKSVQKLNINSPVEYPESRHLENMHHRGFS